MPEFRFPPIEAVMDSARRTAGLDNFGDDSVRTGLGVFLDALQNQARPAEAAGAGLLAMIERRLVSRLEVEEWYRTHPELNDVAVGRTTSITGLPRTGTTALTNILSLDDQFRPLRNWEQVKPVPPPTLAGEATDPRRVAAQAALERLTREQPEFAAMHLSDVDATEEDVELLGMSFHAQQLPLPIFGYHHWWREADLRPAFAYHRRVVKLLQSQRGPDSWLFKAPAHNFHLDALFASYPDTRVIVTHRDPAKAIPSAVSIMAALQLKGEDYDPEQFGRMHNEHFRIGVERSIASRARIGEENFLDVHHRDFVRDPFGTLDRIYAFLGRDLRPEVCAKMEAWHARNRSGAHGSHSYTPEQFGLSAAGIRRDFAFYMERYGVEPEG